LTGVLGLRRGDDLWGGGWCGDRSGRVGGFFAPVDGGEVVVAVAFDDEVGLDFGGFGDAGVGEVDAFDPVFGFVDGFTAVDVAFHEVGHDFGSGGVDVDFEVEDVGDTDEGAAVYEEVIAFDEADIAGVVDAEAVGDDVVGEAGVAGPDHAVWASDEEFEVLAEGFGVDGVGLSFDEGEGDLGAIGELAEVFLEVLIGEVEAVHGKGDGVGFLVEEAAFDEPVELFSEDGFSGARRTRESDEEAAWACGEPHVEEAGEEGAPVVHPFAGVEARANEVVVDHEVQRLVEKPRIRINGIERHVICLLLEGARYK